MATKKQFSKIVWAIEPIPKNERMELNAAKHLREFTKFPGLEIIPISYLFVGDLGLDEEDELEHRINKRLKTYGLPIKKEVILLRDRNSGFVSKIVASVLKQAKQSKADLVVTQTRAKPGRFLLGSFAETISLESRIPILTINPTSTPRRGIKKILFPTEFAPESADIFRNVVRLATQLRAGITLFNSAHRPSVGGRYGSAKRDADEYVRDEILDSKKRAEALIKIARASKVPVKFEAIVEISNSASTILEYAKKNNINLIAMAGKSGRIASALLGSTTRQVIRASECPVWTIHI